MPKGEMVSSEIRKTKLTVASFMAIGVIVALALILLWVVPYYRAI